MGRFQLRKTVLALLLAVFMIATLLSNLRRSSEALVPSNDASNQEDSLKQDAVIPNSDKVQQQATLSDITPKNRHMTGHREVFSASTQDRKFMQVFLGEFDGRNANLIPHPTKAEFWILIVTREMFGRVEPSQELMCTAAIQRGAIVCTEEAVPLKLLSSADGKCEGSLELVQWAWGAQDARVFYGPEIPYILYGSQSQYICWGQWLQDIRQVLPQFHLQKHMLKQSFEKAVEVRRSTGYEWMEKNYFLFWDQAGQIYAHFSFVPNRRFAQLSTDGTTGEDLAKAAEQNDRACMAKFMPIYAKDDPDHEAIHQATNSLSITLCKRADASCVIDDSNTFIMHIFHLKTYFDYHAEYEPYTILFKRSAPFEIHAIAQRPLWIHGRKEFSEASDAVVYREHPETIPKNHTEMFYVTSMNWRSHVQKYHGYLDDIVFLGFGIEDSRPGIMDVEAGDLLQDLAYC